MRISAVRIINFRGYRDSGLIQIGNITAFIGRNDVGKSSILDALNIFFENAKMDKMDVNVRCRADGDFISQIEVHFSDLPTEIDIDAGCKTDFAGEFLLSEDKMLVIVKKFFDAGKARTYIRALHPTHPKCANLLLKKNSDLKKIVDDNKLQCDHTKNSVMRKCIWKHCGDDLQLEEQEIEVDGKEGDLKSLWPQIQFLLPIYSLFRSDRTNDDKDSEIQDPLKEEIRCVIAEQEFHRKLDEMADYVKSKLQDVALRTLEKIKEMCPGVADTLHPKLAAPKWEDVFKGISIAGDEDIPMAKRGSGIRRLILLNFFRAKAERVREDKNAPNVVYAIEEPETSQHTALQHILIEALISVASNPSVQVVLTTHSASVVKKLGFDVLRLIEKNRDNDSIFSELKGCVLPYVSLNEISYLAFEHEASIEYHDELYGHLMVLAEKEYASDQRFCEKAFEEWMFVQGFKFAKKWKRENRSAYDCSLQAYIRNKIHHPENQEKDNEPFTIVELKESIAQMRDALMRRRGS